MTISERLADEQPPITPNALSLLIGCSRWWIMECIRAGHVHSGKIGRTHRIPVSEARRLAKDAGVSVVSVVSAGAP